MGVKELVEKLSPGVRIGWPRTLYNLQNQEANLRAKLVNLVHKRESFNMILLGPPGSGKNTFFESCLGNLKVLDPEFHRRRKVIRLDGILCGRQAKFAVNEIFQQLKIDNDIDGMGSKFDDRMDAVMEMLRSKLKESGATKRSRVFIFLLDNLEYFCEGTQMLLYNLFDSCCNTESCLGVIGLTSRVDITEMFEKRVKSRFSHRIINLTGLRSFEDCLKMAIGLMKLQKDDAWNDKMTAIIASLQSQKILKMLFETDKTVGRLSLFLYEVALASEDISEIQDSVKKTWDRFNTSSKVQQCLNLTVFDMMLIVAIKTIHPNPFRFDTLWKHIHKLASQFGLDKTEMHNSFENLEILELILPVKTRSGGKFRKGNDEFYRSNISYEDLTAAIKTYPQLPSSYQEFTSLN